MFRQFPHIKFIALLLFLNTRISAQVQLPEPPPDSTQYALDLMKEQRKKWGPNDSIVVPAILYHGEIVNYKELEMAWVGNMSPDKLAKYIEEWTRLRNAVYVTYPYARIAGATINDINRKLGNVSNKHELLREEFPHLRFGYFNPPAERIKGSFEKDFAHY